MKAKLFITLLIALIVSLIFFGGSMAAKEPLTNYGSASIIILSLIIGLLMATKLD